jgi:hypothetical protein
MECGERYPAYRPAEILAKLGVLLVLGLTFNRDRGLTETAAVREEHGADFGEAFQRIDLGVFHQMAIGPVIVARR